MQLVQDTLKPRAHNSVVAFSDNSSAIRGFELPVLAAETPGGPSVLSPRTVARSCLLTAETHNAPSAVAPYPGAETGTGGRIRDTHATGRGSHVIAGTTGYAVGHLHIPGYELPWEREFVAAELARGSGGAPALGSRQPFLTGAAAASASAASGHAGTGSEIAGGAAPEAAGLAGGAYTPAERALLYPANVADPLTIEVEASNGASDYGNKFGEPVVAGFTRSVGLHVPVEVRAGAGGSAAAGRAAAGGAGTSGSGVERREYVKPIMFTAGIGALDDAHAEKGAPERGMMVVKLGGPAYRIGMGGSAASSMMHGENKAELDFNAVQRGDAEMEQKVRRHPDGACSRRMPQHDCTIEKRFAARAA
jgi:phosphoribosylformylglycinamidine (FGAM) synthase-like enzyme